MTPKSESTSHPTDPTVAPAETSSATSTTSTSETKEGERQGAGSLEEANKVGYIGVTFDDEPNETYTVEGVTKTEGQQFEDKDRSE